VDVPIDPMAVTVAFAGRAERAVELLPVPDAVPGGGRRPVVVAPAPPLPTAVRRCIALAESALRPGASVAFRPGRMSSVAALDGRWSDVTLPEGAERFERVRLPSGIAAGPVAVVSMLSSGDGLAASPAGLLASFAHPRQRIAAAVGRDEALVAELAAAVPARLLLAAGTVDGLGAAFSAPDLSTAQLLWTALTRRDDGGGGGVPVAWERREVQRAVALCPGPSRPEEMRIRLIVDPQLPRRPEELADLLRLALGPVAVATGQG